MQPEEEVPAASPAPPAVPAGEMLVLLADAVELIDAGAGPQIDVDWSLGGAPVYRLGNGQGVVCRLTATLQGTIVLFVLDGGGWVNATTPVHPAVTSDCSVEFRNMPASAIAATVIDVLL